jgi:hypothetical protein
MFQKSQGCGCVDIYEPEITLNCMTTLLQTRVEHRVAVNFKRAAKQRGKTPYAYLQQIVTQAAAAPEPSTWDNHWKWRASLKMKKVPYNIVAQMREECDEK